MTFAELNAIADENTPDQALAIALALALPDEAERKSLLYLLHPAECPEITEPLPYLIHPPGRLSATSRWLDFRDRTLLPMHEARPDDDFLARFVDQVAQIIAWREALPAEARFWKTDV